LQDPPKFTQIAIFGLKTNHLATLLRNRRVFKVFRNNLAIVLCKEDFTMKAWSLIHDKKQLFSLRDTAMRLKKQRPLHVLGDAGYPGNQGGGHKKNDEKKWRAEEEERHKGSLTKKKKKRLYNDTIFVHKSGHF
jgi:hypothetical protein